MIDAKHIIATAVLILALLPFVKSFAQSATYKPDAFIDSIRTENERVFAIKGITTNRQTT